MAKHPRLQLRGHIYYFRCRVPGDLLAHYGKAVITYSFGTKDGSTAVKLVRQASAHQDTEFEKVRAHLLAPIQTTMSDDEIRRLTQIWIHYQMATDDEVRLIDDGSDHSWMATAGALLDRKTSFGIGFSPEQVVRRSGMSDREYTKARETIDIVIPAARAALGRGDISYIEDEMGDFLEGQGVRLASTSDGYRKLALALLRANVRVLEMQEARLNGEAVDTPPAPIKSLPSIADVTDDIAFSTLWTRYKDQRQPAKKTEADFGTNVTRFIQVNGDLMVKAINKTHVRIFKDAMVKMPVRALKAQRGLAVPELLAALSAETGIPRLSPQTVNEKCLATVKALLGFAVRNGFRDDNPATGILADTPSHAQTKAPPRGPYTLADLQLIFSSPVFSSGERPKAGGGEAAKWLPLLALFTGARLEELGGLRLTDIGEEDGIQFLFIRPDGKNRRLKTRSSRRKIPIHPELVRLGFLDYVHDTQRAEVGQQTMLFPDLSSKQTEITAGFSKWWGRYTDTLGITSSNKVFHSFRHSAERALRNADSVDKVLRDALQGHANDDVSESYGRDEEGLGVALPALNAALRKLAYPGLDLEHLILTLPSTS